MLNTKFDQDKDYKLFHLQERVLTSLGYGGGYHSQEQSLKTKIADLQHEIQTCEDDSESRSIKQRQLEELKNQLIRLDVLQAKVNFDYKHNLYDFSSWFEPSANEVFSNLLNVKDIEKFTKNIGSENYKEGVVNQFIKYFNNVITKLEVKHLKAFFEYMHQNGLDISEVINQANEADKKKIFAILSIISKEDENGENIYNSISKDRSNKFRQR